MTLRGFKIFVAALLFICVAAPAARAQFLQADIGINGLTCSQCSRSVEMQLRKLPFVQAVQMDLEHTQGTIRFVSNRKVDIDALAQAVKDAGFSLRYLKASVDRGRITNSGEQCFRIGNDTYITNKELPVNGVITLTFTGKKFGSRAAKPSSTTTCKGSGQLYYVQLL